MDLGYYRYLAQTIPPRELARALAVRARRALSRGRPFLLDRPEQQRRRERLYARLQERPSLFDAAAPVELPAAAREEILREAEGALR
ncbi:MAG TPA: hypothetical protein VFP52_10010, partial [Myxococcales bacterium]|nr:hypothetical protein [Myxococcales bacterium]